MEAKENQNSEDTGKELMKALVKELTKELTKELRGLVGSWGNFSFR